MAPRRTARGAGRREVDHHTPRRLAAAVVALAGVLCGCSGAQAGSAAVVGGSPISETALQDRVQSFLATLPPAQAATARTDLAHVQTSILNEMVVESVVGRVAGDAGVSVSPAQVSTAVSAAVPGEGAQLDTALAQYDLTRATLPNVVRVSLLYTVLGRHLGGSTLSPQDAQVAAQRYVAAKAPSLPVALNPRYGTWDPATLTLAGSPQSVSTPSPTASAAA